MRRLAWIWIALIFLTQMSMAQTRSPGISARIHFLHEQFDTLVHINSEQAEKYLDTLHILYQQGNYQLANFFYHFDTAYLSFTRHHMEASVSHYRQALEIAVQLDLQQKIIQCLIWLGNHAYFKNQRKIADSLYKVALRQAIEIDDADGIANSYFGLFSLEPDQERMMRYLIAIDSLYESRGMTSHIHANATGHIGKLYLKLDNHKMALHYLKKFEEISRKTHYLPGVSDYLSVMGDLALKEKRTEEARSYYLQLVEESIRRGNIPNQAGSLVQLGELQLETGEYRNALNSLESALALYRPLKDSVNIAHTRLLLSQVNSKLGELGRARELLDSVRLNPKYLSEQNFGKLLLASSIILADKSGDYKSAFKLQRSLDSLLKAEMQQQNTEAIMALEQQYDNAKKEKEISQLKSEKALADQQKVHQRNLLLGGLGLTSLTGIFLFLLLRNRQQTNRRLRELDRLKSNFYANISHEFRTPLTLIAVPLEDLLSQKSLNEKDRKTYEQIYRNARRLEQLVTQLLDLSRLESGKYQLQVSPGEPEAFMNTLGEAFYSLAEQAGLAYTISVQALGECWFDRDLLEKVISNLLSNAIKYALPGGRVFFRVNRLNGQLQVEVENTCAPLKKEQIGRLFDRFYQANEHAEGTGIGLALVRELVRLARGTIEVSQQQGRLKFRILLPVEESCFTPEDKASPNNQNIACLSGDHIKWEATSDRCIADVEEPDFMEEQAILLVVEDNPDVRAYIREIFRNEYRVLDAEHGQTGLEIAITQVPDLIISDVMMPVMDGLTMCRLLKEDQRTSHIPVLLLTARAGEESEFEGLETGADDYIIKPFKSKLLHSRVQNLIKSRSQLRKRYRQEIVLKPRDISITSVDERFLEKVQQLLDERLTEPTFSTMEFSQALGMSRMQLHRKLKALTGLSTSEFIRSQRLKLAHSLLNAGGVRISEIGYQVGFNDPSYFSKCFRAAYGYSPSEYLSRIQAC